MSLESPVLCDIPDSYLDCITLTADHALAYDKISENAGVNSCFSSSNIAAKMLCIGDLQLGSSTARKISDDEEISRQCSPELTDND